MISRGFLKDKFAQALVPMMFASKPFAMGENAKDVFGITIRHLRRNDPHTGYFLIWPGNEEENTVHIPSVDPDISQMVMTVKEAEHSFIAEAPAWAVKNHVKREGAEEALKTLLSSNRIKVADVTEWKPAYGILRYRAKTSGRAMHYLLGRDESDLFISQINRPCTSVRDAMAQMKPTTVTLAEGRVSGKTLRQGEWFLVNLRPDEDEALRKYLKSSLGIIHKKASIGKYAGRDAGKPHIAEELVTLAVPQPPRTRPRNLPATAVWRDPQPLRPSVYVRGHISHPDHHTLKLKNWRKVFLNSENRNATSFGGWID